MADLRVNFLGVEFKNPVLASSGEPTLSLSNMQRVIENRAGGLVVKTLTDSESMRRLTAQTRWRFLDEKHQVCQGTIPRLFTLYGRVGLQDEETDVWLKEIEQVREMGDKEGCVVIGSIASTEVPGWVKLAKMTEQTGVRMMELNFGCPHPSQMEETKTGMLVGQDKELAAEIVKAVSKSVSIPIIVKLTPQVADVAEIAEAVKEAGASAVTVMNRFVGFGVDVERAEPLIYGSAGVGGPWVKPLTLRWVYQVYKDLGIPISGSNGVYDAQDVAEFMMAGATVVEMCSVIMAEGYGWLAKTIKELNDFLDRKGYKTVEEIVGIAAKKALSYAAMEEFGKEKAEVDEDLCTLCERCIETCFYNALKVEDGRLVVDGCRGCGICTCICPEGAISLKGG
ncbi:NAD-dependent dihydropyrimidine dehydrogenase subunit PreA [subsurface metagenome]